MPPPLSRPLSGWGRACTFGPSAGVAEWQTRQTQNLLPVREWGFKSLHPHQLIQRLKWTDGSASEAAQRPITATVPNASLFERCVTASDPCLAVTGTGAWSCNATPRGAPAPTIAYGSPRPTRSAPWPRRKHKNLYVSRAVQSHSRSYPEIAAPIHPPGSAGPAMTRRRITQSPDGMLSERSQCIVLTITGTKHRALDA